MSDIKLDTLGDIELVSGEMTLVDGVDAITQLLSQRLKFFLGEWFLNVDKGVPYFEQVLKKNPNPMIVDTLFKSQILGTPGVLGLNSFDLKIDTVTRSLNLTFQARSTEGLVNFNIEGLGA